MNRVMAIGRLGRDVELRYTSNGKSVAEFSVATDTGYGDNKGTEWLNVIVWDRLAENCAQYIGKGSQVYVEGELRTRSWDDKKTGEKKYRTEVIAREVKFLDPKGERQPAHFGETADVTYEGDVDPSELDF